MSSGGSICIYSTLVVHCSTVQAAYSVLQSTNGVVETHGPPKIPSLGQKWPYIEHPSIG